MESPLYSYVTNSGWVQRNNVERHVFPVP